MKIITISGLDGSGKSTQIKLLKDYLESQGSKVFYFHAIEFGLANKITCLLGHPMSKSKEKSITKANAFQIFLRKIFLRIDIWRFKKVSNKLLASKYDYILSDRYFYDSIVNIEYLSNSSELNSDSELSSEIKPDTAIYLQTSPENIMQRERKPDQGLEYLKKKKEIYDNYAKIWNLKIIDGNRDKNIIFEEIKSLCQI